MTTTPPDCPPEKLEPTMIFAEMPRCPDCGGSKLWTTKTYPIESDGSQTRRCKCASCGRRIILVSE